MKDMLRKIIGLAMVVSLCTSLTIGANAATNETLKNSTNAEITASTTYGWVCTHDGVGVNLRESQSTSSKILAKIPEGTKVTITSILSNWYKVSYNGQTGYIARGYLIDEYGDAI
jgi:uncharacterized protein YgiM (DUF1202 family)